MRAAPSGGGEYLEGGKFCASSPTTPDGQFTYPIAANDDFFPDIRTASLRFLTWTGDKSLFKNVPGLQCRNGTAETPGFLG